MRGEMANSPRRTAAVKIGSTSVAALVADRLAEPCLHRTWVLGLLEAADPAARLAPILQQLAPEVGPAALVGVGEVGRRRPELSEWLQSQAWAVWPLSGREEAQCAWWGVQAGLPHGATVVDVGGGSTEVSDGTHAVSWPFGAAAPPVTDTWAVPPELTVGPRHVVAVGGTVLALSAMAGHTRTLTRAQLALWVEHASELAPLGVAHGVDAARLPLLAGGARALLCSLTLLGAEAVAVSDSGLLQGLWLAARLGRVPRGG